VNDAARAALAALGASAVIATIFSLSYLIVVASGLPGTFGQSLASELLGSFLIALGLMWGTWVFVYRRPKEFFLSTFYTFKKVLRREELSAKEGRSEPFIVDGPYLYVRNPTYFAAFVMTLGVAFLTRRSFVLLGGLGLLLWFNLVVMPYEEREMSALFGQDYVIYVRMVPAFIPSAKAARKPAQRPRKS
jgi:protein-S-isoprenylcysteine O-methyltransferase Ste14